MSILIIRTVPDPILTKKTKAVKNLDKKTLRLIADMKTTLLQTKDPQGVGLAAPQVGKSLRIFMIRDTKAHHDTSLRTFINPEIIYRSKKLNTDVLPQEEWSLEGCLSIPDIYGLVKRPLKIEIKYLDEKGEKKQEKYKGFAASYVQHEYDHLKGILFTERTLKQGGKLYKLTGEKLEEIEI